jgi:hypothetical protein
MSLVKGLSIQNYDFISFYEKVSSFFLFGFVDLASCLLHDPRSDEP